MKFCPKCKKFRHLTDYHQRKNRPGQPYQSYCKDCARAGAKIAAGNTRARLKAKAEFQRKLLDEKIKRGCKVKWTKFFKLIQDAATRNKTFNWDQRVELAIRSGDETTRDQVYSIVDAEIEQTADGLLLTFEVDE